MFDLQISDIKEWLMLHRDEFQKLKSQEFPPIGNELYYMYINLREFIQYYNLKSTCETALLELNQIDKTDFAALSKWTKQYEILGSQNLLMFEVDYLNWHEEVKEDTIKIHEGLYTERKPFANIICLCKVFQLLFWDNSIQIAIPSKEIQKEISIELKTIIENFYRPTT